MEGDVHDLFALLEWSDRVLAHKSTVHLQGTPSGTVLHFRFWTEADVCSILQAMVELIQGLRVAEDAHRVEHGLDTGRRRREAVSRSPVIYLVEKQTQTNRPYPSIERISSPLRVIRGGKEVCSCPRESNPSATQCKSATLCPDHN
jgi:hypothetical protein